MAPFDSTGGDVLVVCAGTHEDTLLTPSDNFNNTWISLDRTHQFRTNEFKRRHQPQGADLVSKNPK